MKKLILLLSVIFTVSCEKGITEPPRILDGSYSVEYKVWEYPNGTKKYFYPNGTDVSNLPITGWMPQTQYTFIGDSLGMSQLMDQGWSEGYVDVEWVNNVPVRVGCHYIESVSDTQISWYQDDVIIRSILIKE